MVVLIVAAASMPAGETPPPQPGWHRWNAESPGREDRAGACASHMPAGGMVAGSTRAGGVVVERRNEISLVNDGVVPPTQESKVVDIRATVPRPPGDMVGIAPSVRNAAAGIRALVIPQPELFQLTWGG